MSCDLINKELNDLLKLCIKHALFGNQDTLELLLHNLSPQIKDYILLNLTKFTNNLVDLISKIKRNTKGYALIIKDVEDIDDPIKTVKIIDNNIFFKLNHLVEFSNNLMIKPIDPSLSMNIYDSLIDVLMTFFYNDKYYDSLKQNNYIYAKINFDQTSHIIKSMVNPYN
jgi:hypothetical protein